MQMKKVLTAVLILCIAFGFWYFTYKKTALIEKQTTSTSQEDLPKIVSTKPDPLEDNIVSTTQPIEITFNRSLENSGEFKLRIEPKTDYKIELSSDRKTARIIFVQSLELGTTYTLFIGPETKFDGIGRWGQEEIFHIKTVTYRGV